MPVYAITLSHREGSDSPHSQATLHELVASGVDLGAVDSCPCYLIQGDFTDDQASAIARLLADPVLETYTVTRDAVPASESGTQVTIFRRSGVMDPVESSVLTTLANAGFSADAAKCAHVYRFAAQLSNDDAERAAGVLGNAAIEEHRVGGFEMANLKLGSSWNFVRTEVPFRDLDDEALMKLNREMGLSMNMPELKAVQAWFVEAGREPCDVELEMVAQTWSEHCKHKTLTGPVNYSEAEGTESLRDLAPEIMPESGPINGLLQSTIKRATDELDRDWCWSVFVDNAGVIKFDDEDGICVKVETHNHPSAIEPYGGAGTGIGGVIRDILGTGLGAKPVMNTDVFCFGYPDMKREDVPKGALHPMTTLRGVVAGVRDYGNRMGIPTANGALCFDERYTGNPLVYAGSIGIIPKDKVEKQANPGDAIVAVGGRTGRDGIGGATFSSVELTEESEVVSAGAVQIGNAIQEKVVLDTLLQARDLDLYSCVTDCGAGGFSSAVGEMGEVTGAHVELKDAPLKYDGLSYREIWLSEAQERMVFAVPQDKLDAFLKLFAAEDVECAVLGTFSGDGQMIVKYDGNVVLDMPMSFLHDGLPKVERSAEWTGPTPIRHNTSALEALKPTLEAGGSVADKNAAILGAILASPNVCSKEYIVRQYDHEVQAASAIKPFTGVYRDGPSDGAAMMPKPGSNKAFVVGSGINPHFGDLDPYWMAMSVIDEAVRNAVCTGGNPDHTAILDNFSWGNCDKPDRLGGMVRACAGCFSAAKGLGTPFISGKDSLNNEFATEDGVVAIPPTLLVTATSVTTVDTLTTMDLKKPGNLLFQVGLTHNEFGASHYDLVTGGSETSVPRYDPASALALYRAVYKAQQEGIVRSAHDCSEGGLAAALTEMAFAGQCGVEVNLSADLAADDAAENDKALLFAESNARIVLEVTPDNEAKLTEIFDGLACTKLGSVSDSPSVVIHGLSGEAVLNADYNAMRKLWKEPLYKAVGEEVPQDV